jgi:hypothetical protein
MGRRLGRRLQDIEEIFTSLVKTWYIIFWNSKRPYISWSRSKNKNELWPEIEKRIIHANRACKALLHY